MNLAKIVTNLITQIGFKYTKKFKCRVNELGVKPEQIAFIAKLIHLNIISMKTGYIAFEILIKNEQRSKKRIYETRTCTA